MLSFVLMSNFHKYSRINIHIETIKFTEMKANTILHKRVLFCDFSYPVRFFNFLHGCYSRSSTSSFLLDQTSNFKKIFATKSFQYETTFEVYRNFNIHRPEMSCICVSQFCSTTSLKSFIKHLALSMLDV